MLNAGDEAPDFELPDQDGSPVRLSSLRGRPVVLYFYPKADTPGCTTQACGIRDRGGEYAALGAVVLGVSPDAPRKLRRFADKYELDFTLLGASDHAVSETYGTWVEKSMYGRKYMGVQRATFVIAPEGRVATVLPKVSPKTHDDEVLAALGELGTAAEAPARETRGCCFHAKAALSGGRFVSLSPPPARTRHCERAPCI